MDKSLEKLFKSHAKKMDKIYIVTSREVGPVYASRDKELAEIKVKERIYIEEMQGGRPSVFIVELELN